MGVCTFSIFRVCKLALSLCYQGKSMFPFNTYAVECTSWRMSWTVLCSFFCLQMVPTCRRFLHKSSFPWTYLLSDSCSFSFLHCLCCFMGCLPRAFLSLDWPRCSCKDCSPIRFHFQLQSNSVRCDLTLLFY